MVKSILDFNESTGGGLPVAFLKMKRYDAADGSKSMKFFCNYSTLSEDDTDIAPYARLFKKGKFLDKGFVGVISNASLRFSPANIEKKIQASWDMQLESEINVTPEKKIKIIIQESTGSRRILDLMNPILAMNGITIDNHVSIVPYEFKDKVSGKPKSGCSIKDASTNEYLPKKFNEWDSEAKFFVGIPPINYTQVGLQTVVDTTIFERFMFMECFYWIKEVFGEFPKLTPLEEVKKEAMQLLKNATTNQARSHAAAMVSILIRDESTRKGLIEWYNQTFPQTPIYALDGVGFSFVKPTAATQVANTRETTPVADDGEPCPF